MLRNWLDAMTRQRSDSGAGHPPRGRAVSFRPVLQALEDRFLPSTVTTLADDGAGSLREALAITKPGGVVNFAPHLSGTIVLTSGPLSVAKDLLIAGPGVDTITVSGNDMSRVFHIDPLVTVTITGLTIANGYASDDGGGIENQGTLVLFNSVLRDNTTATGGGGLVNDGQALVLGSTVIGNQSLTFRGGGIENNGTLTVVASTVRGNMAGFNSGGIANAGQLVVSNSTISDNTSATFGGGLTTSGFALVIDSAIAGNHATLSGGGIALSTSGVAVVINSAITGNTTQGNGGGISNSGTMLVVNCAVTANEAIADGGGIFNAATGFGLVVNPTLSGNTAGGEGNDTFNVPPGILLVIYGGAPGLGVAGRSLVAEDCGTPFRQLFGSSEGRSLVDYGNLARLAFSLQDGLRDWPSLAFPDIEQDGVETVSALPSAFGCAAPAVGQVFNLAELSAS